MSDNDKKIEELYEARNEHETRISLIENKLDYIKGGIDEIKENVRRINGTPEDNRKDINDILENKCGPRSETIEKLKTGYTIGLVIAIMITVFIAPLAVEVIGRLIGRIFN